MRARWKVCCDGRLGASRVVGAGAVGLVAGLAVFGGPLGGTALADSTVSLTTPGEQILTVPANVTGIAATAIGGAGGDCFDGAGGEAASVGATFAVTPGQQLLVIVAGPGQACANGGQGGVGGGAAGGAPNGGEGGAGGGGASVVSGSPFDPAGSPLLVAAGGGGAAVAAGGVYGVGGNAGAPGGNDVLGAGAGGAGTATAGGSGGVDNNQEGNNGGPGGSLTGGSGGGGSNGGGGGGGGAGLFGGGGGVGGGKVPDGGGGGGASYIATDATSTSGPTLSTATPSVTITFETATADLSSNALALGSEPVGSVGAEQTVTVTNNGDARLLVSGVQAGGADPGDYLISDRCQLPVAPGTSCQIGVRFAPQQRAASSATLTLLTAAPNAPAPIALSGNGTAPATATAGPQGPAGPRGATGPQGASGPQGPAGPAGQVVCRDTLLARSLCTLEFAPRTFAVQRASGKSEAIHASFVLKRFGHRIRAGRITAKAGKATHKPIGRLARGRYTLIISTGHGRHRKLLLTFRFRVR